MKEEKDTNQVYKCDFRHPQLNFAVSGNKRREPEAEFANVFVDVYKKNFSQIHSSSNKKTALFVREVPVSGNGIADLLVLNWANDSLQEDQVSPDFSTSETTIRAFEFKLSDWRNGLMQAHRYKYFSNASILVVPKKKLKMIMEHLEMFQKLRIGLWGFEPESQKITRAFTPRPKHQQIHKYKTRALELVATAIPS